MKSWIIVAALALSLAACTQEKPGMRCGGKHKGMEAKQGEQCPLHPAAPQKKCCCCKGAR